MIKPNKFIPLVLLFSLFLNMAKGQGKNESQDLNAYKDKVRQLVQFLEYSLNLIGSDTVSAEDKEAIFRSSYLKVFRDDKVQIEDDLDQRLVVTNKSVKAYLQDVDYFFREARFSFDIHDITYSTGDKNIVYYKVTLTRRLQGITINNETVQNTKRRFIELNLDTKKKDLRIVSIYTVQVSEEQDLANWWKELPLLWKQILRPGSPESDAPSYNGLKKITETKELILSGNTAVSTLEPLVKLDKLISLDISGTGVNDLAPILNLNELETLNISNTGVTSADPLKYGTRLKQLIISGSKISSLDPIRSCTLLEHLDISGTPVQNLEPLTGLANLRSLKLSYTPVADLSPLKGMLQMRHMDLSYTQVENISILSDLKELEELSFSNTKVENLSPLKQLKKLKTLNFNATLVNSLGALAELPLLEKVYCDNTRIDKKEIVSFVRTHPGILVVYQSEVSGTWWSSLAPEWKKVFSGILKINGEPGKEQLASIIKLDSLNVSGNKEIKDLGPLKEFVSLRTLQISNTSVKDLKPVSNIQSLTTIDFSGTGVSELAALKGLKNLKLIKCNNTAVRLAQVEEFNRQNPKCLIIFQSQHLSGWWKDLSSEWKKIFAPYLKTSNPNEEQLHKFINSDSLAVHSSSITSLEPLLEFRNLRKLEIYNAQLTSIDMSNYSPSLEHLRFGNMPLNDIAGLDKLRLRSLAFSNTAIKDLKKVTSLKDLENLECSGTKVKNLKPLKELPKLKRLSCSNTRICSLKPLEKLETLQYLSCFNTRISKKKVEKFRKNNPSLRVEHF